MSRSQDRLSLKRTLGISTVLHLLLAPLFITSAAIGLAGQGAAGGSGATETMRVSYLSIQHRPPATHRAASTARSMPKITKRIAATTHARVAARQAATRPSHPDRSAAETEASGRPRTSGAVGRIAISIATAAPERAAPAIAQPVATPQPTRPAPRDASPVPTATAAPSAAPPQVADAAARGSDAPPGAWGQSFDRPLIADETALTDLRSHYHARSAITIEVDEAGHATHVTLPGDMPDDVRAELDKRLRELRYVPAECNGLRCGGTLSITI